MVHMCSRFCELCVYVGGQDLRVCALSCLVNVLYKNPDAQRFVLTRGTIQAVVQFLALNRFVTLLSCNMISYLQAGSRIVSQGFFRSGMRCCSKCMYQLVLVAALCLFCSPAVTKAAAFCLGNMVRDDSDSQLALVSAGGVEALVDVINDQHDDEASKKVIIFLLLHGFI